MKSLEKVREGTQIIVFGTRVQYPQKSDRLGRKIKGLHEIEEQHVYAGKKQTGVDAIAVTATSDTAFLKNTGSHDAEYFVLRDQHFLAAGKRWGNLGEQLRLVGRWQRVEATKDNEGNITHVSLRRAFLRPGFHMKEK